jgi:hypothetical protein
VFGEWNTVIQKVPVVEHGVECFLKDYTFIRERSRMGMEKLLHINSVLYANALDIQVCTSSLLIITYFIEVPK